MQNKNNNRFVVLHCPLQFLIFLKLKTKVITVQKNTSQDFWNSKKRCSLVFSISKFIFNISKQLVFSKNVMELIYMYYHVLSFLSLLFTLINFGSWLKMCKSYAAMFSVCRRKVKKKHASNWTQCAYIGFWFHMNILKSPKILKVSLTM